MIIIRQINQETSPEIIRQEMDVSIGLTIIVSLAMTILGLTWSVPFVFGHLIGWHIYVITDTEEIKFIQSTLKPYSSLISSDKASGFIIGRWYIGLMHSESRWHTLHLLCSKKFYENIIKKQSVAPATPAAGAAAGAVVAATPAERLKVFERQGPYSNPFYVKRFLDISYITARPAQNVIITNIIDSFKQNRNHLVVYIHGAPGCGKSLLAMILAGKLGGAFNRSFNPTSPGDSIGYLYNWVIPSKEAP